MNRTKLVALSMILSIAISSCIVSKKNQINYVAPDYSLVKNWAALPTKKDPADKVPKRSNLTNEQDSAGADVFFLHYTTFYFTLLKTNTKLNNVVVNSMTDHLSIKYQASVFNGSCKVYAPRYRQASIYSFFNTESEKGKRTLDFAYEDIKKAFEYYLAHYNNDRPFIIASHSQGSYHAQRLIKEYIDTNPELYKKFICAYIVGWANQDNYSTLVPCDSASQTGCFMGWQTTRWKTKRTNHLFNKMLFKPADVCVNPLTWTSDTSYVGRDKNKGGEPIFMRKIHPRVCDAQIHDHLLWIHHPRKLGYNGYMLHYHFFDYNLFYMNIRENVKLRVDNFLIK